MEEFIKIRGARENNLKNIDLDIPKNKLVVVTGVSGSGKSSLVFDTIYAEGQRRYVESLSAYARQFLGVLDKPDVDLIEGLSPAIAIDQKSVSHNPRSTVGTITEIYDYLRLLFARIGHPHCPNCGREIGRQSPQEIAESILIGLDPSRGSRTNPSKRGRGVRLLVLAPVIRGKKGEFSQLFQNLKKQGYSKVRVDGGMRGLDEDFGLIRTNKHDIEVVIDRLVISRSLPRHAELGSASSKKILKWFDLAHHPEPVEGQVQDDKGIKSRLIQSIEAAAKIAYGNVVIGEVLDKTFDFPEYPKKIKEHLFSENFACPVCNLSLPEMEPRSFSFNSPFGACPKCAGIGFELKVDPALVINPELSISEGGILPWTRLLEHDSWFSRLLESVARDYKFSFDTPLKDLPEKIKQILLYGETVDPGFAKIPDLRPSDPGSGSGIWKSNSEEFFEGVIANLTRRYKETESDFVRREIEKYMTKDPCPACLGKRLKKDSLAVTVLGKNISEVSHLSLEAAYLWVNGLVGFDPGIRSNLKKGSNPLTARETVIARPIAKEIKGRLKFLLDVGLAYLTISRESSSLAGGEAQRIRLASQIGTGLSGVIYCLDEPSIGLHGRDQARLIETLKKLRDLGNSVLVVEHDPQTMKAADYLVDVGPGAGEHGGKIISLGTPQQVMKDPKSLTGQYLSGKKKIEIRSSALSHAELDSASTQERSRNKFGMTIFNSQLITKNPQLSLHGCREHNLQNINVRIPLGKLVCVTGVSGSGKSTLVNETLYRALRRHLGLVEKEKVGLYDFDEGFENIDKVINIDQSPIGRTPRSNPVTYIKTFDEIRKLFSRTKEARLKGFDQGRFSFNVRGGRCETCQGDGSIRVEMQFLPDIYVKCDACQGRRYNEETLEVTYNNKNIYEVLEMTVEEALKFFAPIPNIVRGLQTLFEVGLGYIHLGQSATTLSGGEAQRIKLSLELSKRATGKTLYLLDEPTTGLHFADLERLLKILRALVAKGNSVIVIEHNLEVIKSADFIIDLGPEGGEGGGRVIAEASPEQLKNTPKSYTGQELRLS